MSDVINFYRTSDPFGEFSNFAAFPIMIDGRRFPTSEHYFQTQKFENPQDVEEILAEESPMKAAQMGRDRNRKLRADWEAIKDEVMRRAVFEKFSQHPQLKRILLSTGDAQIVEHTKNDRYWADGGDGTGKNMLGLILMEVREKLRANSHT